MGRIARLDLPPPCGEGLRVGVFRERSGSPRLFAAFGSKNHQTYDGIATTLVPVKTEPRTIENQQKGRALQEASASSAVNQSHQTYPSAISTIP
ncbi:protein of unknown function [Aminobacter niigataensis]|nr:protein of unknown function [Aminobacter niigataensis]